MAHEELKVYLRFEEEFWRQTPTVQWFEEGDRNTKFFHSLVRGRRNRLYMRRIIKSYDSWAESENVIDEEGNCWDTIGSDVIKVVQALFKGATLPKRIAHTNMVLLPKKDFPQSFSDLRPSLSNFLNKIISRLVHERMEVLLPRFISLNQSGFVKGRNTTENVLLAQEIITDNRLTGKPDNVIIKLDMAKAYDRLIGIFLLK
ncbi:hypothetical protein KY290_021155 [Solanum tuberosum]|uniref:Reverse transcriptase domain-containing protein n=1 Tax=Solanum tuberosum TaxID=4113 RepID=A0ABQ7V0R2_SOLTU|nr:hypothetical protein KY290_021155 [Solanum tuberosum]